jgi:hypothetical protein
MFYLFCSHKFNKIENNFIFEKLKKKSWPNFKLSLSSLKYGFGIWDPGSRKTYPGSRIQGSKSTGSQIPELAFKKCFFLV